MDWIKKWLRQVPIPAAFVICGLTALLAALSLTRVTMRFAQKNKEEIAESYAYMELIPRELEQELQSSLTEPTELEPVPFTEAQSEEAALSAEVQPEDAVPSMKDEPEEAVPFTEAQQEEQPPVQAEQPEQEQHAVVYAMPPYAEMELPVEDRKKYDFYEDLDNAAAIFWYSACLCLSSLVFYLWKMKKPLRTLNQAAQKISNNDLNFQIDYNDQDELGRLCQAFESMRRELVQNNRKLWNSVEQRKRLNAAFAHDMRTPLTVLQGHTDILLDALADGQVSNQDILPSIQAISNQVTRLNSYMDTMNALRRLEDYEPSLRSIASETLSEMLEETAASLFPRETNVSASEELANKSTAFSVEKLTNKNTAFTDEMLAHTSTAFAAEKLANTSTAFAAEEIAHTSTASKINTDINFEINEQELWLDKEAFSQIYENLLSNAARYARKSIHIRLYREQDFVVLEIADDGAGFTQKDLKNAFAPYYRGERNRPASSAHFGLGLYICNLLAEKLGGGMQLDNGENGGAKVTVKIISFQKSEKL